MIDFLLGVCNSCIALLIYIECGIHSKYKKKGKN